MAGRLKVLGAAAVGLALSGTARAERLVRCEVQLERSVGVVQVPGWGPDEATARMRAEAAAWSLAWADRLPMILVGGAFSPEESGKRDAALRKALDPTTDWRVPGFAVRPGDCSTETVSGEKGAAWAAHWEREDRKAIRIDPSVAIEAARRRQCFGVWSHRMIGAATVGKDASSEQFAAAWVPARSGTDGLFRCMTRGQPLLVSAGGPLAGIDDPGPIECRRPRRIDGRWSAAPGWGADLESAREAALQTDLELALVRLEQMLSRVRTMPAGPERAAAAEAVALAHLGGLVVATDLAEQALMSCEATAPKNVRPTWDLPEGLQCGGWPVEPWTSAAADPTGLSRTRSQVCSAAFRVQASSDWSAALACVASCRADLDTAGWDGKLVWRPSEPPRATVEQAEKLLSAALSGKDFHLLGIATGGLIFEASYAAAFKANPGAFWGSIQQAKESGSWGDLAYWEQVGGAWVLAFKERR